MTLPFLIGHRGLAGAAPENTLAGLRKAAEMGLNMVEVDLKLTADNRVILFHDDDLDRTTDGSGPVKDKTLEEISALDAGITFHKSFVGEPVPTLEEAIDTLDHLNILVNLEIKPCPGREEETARIAVATALDAWPEHLAPPLLSSFSWEAAILARKLAPDWPVALLVDRLLKDWKEQAAALGTVAVHLDQRYLTKRQTKEIKDNGQAVFAWTVNDPARAAELNGWGVDGIFTDNPALVRQKTGSET